MNLGRLLEAEAALRDALGREPNDAQALAQLGEVFFRSAHYAGAAKFWLQVMDEDGEMGRKLGLPGKIATGGAAPVGGPKDAAWRAEPLRSNSYSRAANKSWISTSPTGRPCLSTTGS